MELLAEESQQQKKFGISNFLSTILWLFRESIISGGIAGISIDLALFPLDTLKTRLQAKKSKNVSSNNVGSAPNKVSNYSGLKSSMIASFPAAAVFFSSYDLTRYILKFKLNVKSDVLINMIAAALGEAFQTIVRNPFELVKQNMQIGKFESISKAMKYIIKTKGLSVIKI